MNNEMESTWQTALCPILRQEPRTGVEALRDSPLRTDGLQAETSRCRIRNANHYTSIISICGQSCV